MSEPTPTLRLVRDGDEHQAAPTADEPPKLRTAWAADELMMETFPPVKWAVNGLVAEGVNLLAGPPKVGKSWLSLGLGLAVAGGDDALGSIPTQAGPVLYLALEDTPRRLQSRMGKILDGRPAPHGLTLATMCPPLPEGGASAIAGWLERNPAARMVVIDVFAKVRGRAITSGSQYDADYAAIGHAKKLADSYGVAMVLVHHVRKAGAEDFLEAVSGTNGLAGAADATLVLRRPRGEADGILAVTGRDVDESEHALRFTADSGSWTLLDGPPGDYAMSGNRAAILRYLRSNPGGTPKVIAEALGMSRDTAKKTCQRMSTDGQLAVDAGGRYRPADEPGTPAGTSAPETVPGVPGVPEPLPTCNDGPESRGHPAGTGVPAVPAVLVESWPGQPEAGQVADALSRGESVPGGPGACATCGHLTLWHREPGSTRGYRGQPCQKCECAAFTDQPANPANEETQ